MYRTYGVVWREGAAPLATGKLELLPLCLRLEGRENSKVIPWVGVQAVRVGRSAAERINGYASVVVERPGVEPVAIVTVGQPSLVGEIVERLAAIQLTA